MSSTRLVHCSPLGVHIRDRLSERWVEELHLLDLDETLPLVGQQMVELLVKLPDLQLGFQVHLVVVLRPHPVLRFLSILAHHDDRRLDGRQTGENQVEEDERIRVDGSPVQDY